MTKLNFTEIVAVVDRSSSMMPLAKETIQGFNHFLNEQKKEPGEAVLTLATFASDYKLIHNAVPVQSIPELNSETYSPSGMTALLDAIGKTVNNVGMRLASMKEEDRPSKILFLIMTDGEENQSREFAHNDIMNMISHQRDKYSWEFVFIGANQDAIAGGASIGIAANNSYNYVADAVGSSVLFENMTKGVSNYRNAVAGEAFNMVDPTIGLAGDAGGQFLKGVQLINNPMPVMPVTVVTINPLKK